MSTINRSSVSNLTRIGKKRYFLNLLFSFQDYFWVLFLSHCLCWVIQTIVDVFPLWSFRYNTVIFSFQHHMPDTHISLNLQSASSIRCCRHRLRDITPGGFNAELDLLRPEPLLQGRVMELRRSVASIYDMLFLYKKAPSPHTGLDPWKLTCADLKRVNSINWLERT